MVSETIIITIKQTAYFTMVAWLVLVSEAKTSKVVASLFFLFSSFQKEVKTTDLFLQYVTLCAE